MQAGSQSGAAIEQASAQRDHQCGELTRLLQTMDHDDRAAFDQLFELVCLLAQQRQDDAIAQFQAAAELYRHQLGRSENDPQLEAIRKRLAALPATATDPPQA